LKNKGPLFIVPWRCTFACDSGCAHCVSACKTAFPDEVDTKGAMRIVDQVHDFGATFFGITGGQPFLRKDLFEVLDYATSLGLNTSIITDGRMLDEKAIKDIIRNKTKISISIDGAQKTNDAIRGEGAYAAAVAAIERFAKEDLLNVLVYTFANKGTITNVDEEDMVHVIELAKKYGARWVVFHGFVPYSNDAASLKADPTPKQYEWACNKLFDLTAKYNGSQIAATGFNPSHAIPAQKVTACCSAIPTSKERSGKRSSARSIPVPSGIAAVRAMIFSSRSISSHSVSPKTDVYAGGACLLDLYGNPVSGSNGPVA
jgi:MoaA/NifB/PqqE/SkfB family radical SAM enzyme